MSWQSKRLVDICEIRLGKTPSRSDKSYWDEEKNSSNIWVSIADLTKLNTRFISDSKEYITDKGATLFQPVKAGTLLMSFKLSIGKLAFAHCDLFTNEAIVALPIKVKNLIDSDFLYYFLQYYDWDKETENDIKLKGKTLNKAKLSEIKVPLPPLATQRKIVAKLDAIFAEIDKATAAAAANAKNAEALFQSYLTQVIESGSEGWREFQIKELGKVVTGNTPTTSEPKNYGDFISFVKPGDFNSDGTIDLEKQKLSQIGMSVSRVVKEKSALMVCIGATIGKCGFVDVDVVTNQQINSVTPNSDFSHKFIYLQMLTSSFQKKILDSSGQATLPIINKSKWESLTMKFPPLSKQIEIVERFENLRFETVNLKNSQIEKIKNCHQLKQSILKKAFAGELVKE